MTHKRVLIEARTIDGRVIYLDGGIEYYKHTDEIFYCAPDDSSKCLLDTTSGEATKA